MLPQDFCALTPENCDQNSIEVTGGIKLADQLALTDGDGPGASGRAQCRQEAPSSRRGDWSLVMWKGFDLPLLSSRVEERAPEKEVSSL